MNSKPARLVLLTIVALIIFIGGLRVIPVLTTRTQTDIEKLVAARMDNSTPPQFSNVQRDKVNENLWCGEVSSKNNFGVSVDHQRFFVLIPKFSSTLIEFDTPDNRDFIDKMCGGTPLQASDWVSVGKSEDGSEEFADIANIRVDDNIRRARIKSVYAPQSQRDRDDPTKWWSSAENQRAFNCKEGTSRRESMTIFFSDGTDLSIPAKNLPTPWAPVSPNTMLGEDINFICAWKAR
ncbi:MAG: surface-adhesin E family protein [Steroidobacteraceae bacterium]